MKLTIIQLLGLLVWAFFLAGCGVQTSIPQTGVQAAGAAAVTRVDALVLVQPRGEVRVLASGLLPGGCYRLGQATVNRSGDVFTIDLPMMLQVGANCSQEPEVFERVIVLPDVPLPGGSYLVKVNNVEGAFTVPGETLAQVVTAEPLPTQEATVPQVTAIPEAPGEPASPSAENPPPTAEPAKNCADRVAFVSDVTIPDFATLKAGETFTKTWQVKNLGSCAWSSDYKLVFKNGEAMTAEEQVSLPAAEPGATTEVSIPMRAPARQGGYTGNWEFINPQGEVISLADSPVDWIWIKVNVGAQVQAQTQVESQPPPAPTMIPPLGVASCPAQPDETFAGQVLSLINEQRAKLGVPALKLNSLLTAAAVQHSKDMACNNFVEHYGTNGSTWFTRIQAQGYAYAYAAENVAAGEPKFGGTASWVVTDNWMNSQIHRENILNPQVTEIGVAMVYSNTARWGAYTTVNFASPKR